MHAPSVHTFLKDAKGSSSLTLRAHWITFPMPLSRKVASEASTLYRRALPLYGREPLQSRSWRATLCCRQWGFLADEYPKRNRSGRLQRTARWGLRRMPFAQQSVAAEYAEIPWRHGILGYGNQADRYSELGYRPRSVSFLQLFTARFSPSFKSIGQVRTFYFPRYGIETHIPSGFHQEHRERLFHVL